MTSAPGIDNPRLAKFGWDPALEPEIERAKAGDWLRLEAFLSGQSDLQLRDRYLTAVTGSLEKRPRWIDDWVSARPDPYLPLLFRGRHWIDWAWDARGGGRAKTVADGAWALFHERLQVAQVDLERAASLAPEGDPGPWVAMLPLAMGLGFEKAVVMAIFEEIQKRTPWNHQACSSMVQVLAPKWGGSWSLLFDFANWVLDEAPDGANVNSIMVEAHIEGWIEEGSRLYLRLPGVREDVFRAAARSVDSPHAQASAVTLATHSLFLYTYGLMREWGPFQRELEYVQGRLGSRWALLSDPIKVYDDMRKRQTAALGR
jgi:hypothetical protein